MSLRAEAPTSVRAVVEGIQEPEDNEPSLAIDVDKDDGAHPSHPINLSISFLDDEIDSEVLGPDDGERAPGTDLWLNKTPAKHLAAILNSSRRTERRSRGVRTAGDAGLRGPGMLRN